MTTPQSNTQKALRRSAKKGKSQQSRSAVSETEVSDYPLVSQGHTHEGKSKQRRKSQAQKPITNYDSTAHSDGYGASNPYSHHPAKSHVTPIKQQAYAGPTFHQSPAASALPIPSFYSKSMPTTSMMKPVPEDVRPVTEQGSDHATDPIETKRESTPLDFLFDAARKAQGTPGTENHPRHFLSPEAGKSPSRSPAPRDNDGMFPFEMDSGNRTPGENRSAASTPFKDRLEAARPHSSAANPQFTRSLDENERKAKAAALKTFLMNSAQAIEAADNPFNARPAPQSISPQYSYRVNPTSPLHGVHGNSAGHQYFPLMSPNGPMSPSARPPSSNLRHIYAPDTKPEVFKPKFEQAEGSPGHTTIHDHRHQQQQQQTPRQRPYEGQFTPPQQESPPRQSTPSAQQLEDDLRRFLKLDLTSRG